jgi:hypothetical protein
MEDCCHPAASVKLALSAVPPKFKSKSLVECHSDSARPTRGVVVDCDGKTPAHHVFVQLKMLLLKFDECCVGLEENYERPCILFCVARQQRDCS